MDMLLGAEKSDNIKKVRATCIFWAMVHHPLRNVSLGVVREVPVFRLHQEMLGRHQGLVLDHCKNEHRHKYTNTWIIALAMSRRGRILLVLMELSIGCYCYCEDDPGVT